MSMLLTKRPNKDQRLMDLIGGNNSCRNCHRVWDYGPSSNYQLVEGKYMMQHVQIGLVCAM